MARITVAGSAIVVESAMTLEDVKTLKKYRPEALTLYSQDEAHEPLFQLDIATSGVGSISKYGAVFATANSEGKATLTMVCDNMPKEFSAVQEMIADQIGSSLNYINELESYLPEVLSDVKAERDAIMASITLA